ncbi:MAG: hypothetical protein IKJ65_01945 [Clostridia bacterium]|nr:hypothetical protein [Clostridia bacterium]
MNGITYGNYHTYTAFGLFLKHWEITPPAPRRHKVTIPGRHGALDTSKTLTGEVLYDNRTLTAIFEMMGAREEWAGRYSEILQAIHGKELQIILDDDPDFYYTGFVEVGDFPPDNATAIITITADVYPFKRERNGEGVKM